MNADPTLVVHRDLAELSEAVAGRLVSRIGDLHHTQDAVSLALTGGGAGTAVLRAVAQSPDHTRVDWSRVDLWWGDERFLPPGDPERNETQAREALIDRVPIPAERVHPMGADAAPFADDPEAAAAAYASELEAGLQSTNGVLDIVLLGVGPDGHVASLFPEHSALHDTGAVIAVHDAPKPPPTRISLAMATIRSADEVWLVVAGTDKARAVATALAGTGAAPAAAAQGTQATRWFLDEAAASGLPADMGRRESR